MRVLVTGATGFVGGHLVPVLLDRGDDVLAVIRPGSRAPVGTTPLEIDLATFGMSLPSVDAVVHLAQGDAGADAGVLYGVNAVATLGLAQAVVPGGSLVLASSGAVYGFGARPFRESDTLQGDSLYAVSKAHAERFAALGRSAADTSILRLFFPYGDGLPERRLVADVARRVATGVPVELNAHAKPAINPVYVGDVVAAICACLDRGGRRVLNVAGPDRVDLRGLAEVVGSVVGATPVFAETGRHADGDIVGDIEEFRTFLGREPVGLQQGLPTLVAGH